MPAFGPSTLQTAPQDGPVLGKRKTKVDAPPMPGARVGQAMTLAQAEESLQAVRQIMLETRDEVFGLLRADRYGRRLDEADLDAIWLHAERYAGAHWQETREQMQDALGLVGREHLELVRHLLQKTRGQAWVDAMDEREPEELAALRMALEEEPDREAEEAADMDRELADVWLPRAEREAAEARDAKKASRPMARPRRVAGRAVVKLPVGQDPPAQGLDSDDPFGQRPANVPEDVAWGPRAGTEPVGWLDMFYTNPVLVNMLELPFLFASTAHDTAMQQGFEPRFDQDSGSYKYYRTDPETGGEVEYFSTTVQNQSAFTVDGFIARAGARAWKYATRVAEEPDAQARTVRVYQQNRGVYALKLEGVDEQAGADGAVQYDYMTSTVARGQSVTERGLNVVANILNADLCRTADAFHATWNPKDGVMQANVRSFVNSQLTRDAAEKAASDVRRAENVADVKTFLTAFSDASDMTRATMRIAPMVALELFVANGRGVEGAKMIIQQTLARTLDIEDMTKRNRILEGLAVALSEAEGADNTRLAGLLREAKNQMDPEGMTALVTGFTGRVANTLMGTLGAPRAQADLIPEGAPEQSDEEILRAGYALASLFREDVQNAALAREFGRDALRNEYLNVVNPLAGGQEEGLALDDYFSRIAASNFDSLRDRLRFISDRAGAIMDSSRDAMAKLKDLLNPSIWRAFRYYPAAVVGLNQLVFLASTRFGQWCLSGLTQGNLLDGVTSGVAQAMGQYLPEAAIWPVQLLLGAAPVALVGAGTFIHLFGPQLAKTKLNVLNSALSSLASIVKMVSTRSISSQAMTAIARGVARAWVYVYTSSTGGPSANPGEQREKERIFAEAGKKVASLWFHRAHRFIDLAAYGASRVGTYLRFWAMTSAVAKMGETMGQTVDIFAGWDSWLGLGGSGMALTAATIVGVTLVGMGLQWAAVDKMRFLQKYTDDLVVYEVRTTDERGIVSTERRTKVVKRLKASRVRTALISCIYRYPEFLLAGLGRVLANSYSEAQVARLREETADAVYAASVQTEPVDLDGGTFQTIYGPVVERVLSDPGMPDDRKKRILSGMLTFSSVCMARLLRNSAAPESYNRIFYERLALSAIAGDGKDIADSLGKIDDSARQVDFLLGDLFTSGFGAVGKGGAALLESLNQQSDAEAG